MKIGGRSKAKIGDEKLGNGRGPCGSLGRSLVLETKGSMVGFLVRERAWATGAVAGHTVYGGSRMLCLSYTVIEQTGLGQCSQYTITERIPLSPSGGPLPHTHLLDSQCPLPGERRLSMPQTGEKEINYLLKSYTDLE